MNWTQLRPDLWAVVDNGQTAAAVRRATEGFDAQVRGSSSAMHAGTLAEAQRLAERAMGGPVGVTKLSSREVGPEPKPLIPDKLMRGYDVYIVTFSGGKDSLACVLHLLELGIPKDKIELWHHDVDGREGSDMWDWPVTRDYCRQVAVALDLPIYFSWKVGGFEGEMNRDNDPTPPTRFEYPADERLGGGPGGKVVVGQAGGKTGALAHRMEFPKLSGLLTERWCSGSLKVDVCSVAINNQMRLRGKRICVVSGERQEENGAWKTYLQALDRSEKRGPPLLKGRASYAVIEPHRTSGGDADDAFRAAVGARKKAGTADIGFQLGVFWKVPREGGRRYADQWRPVLTWREEHVWDIIRRHGIIAHPAYHLGWGRLSCMTCIFGNANQFASVKAIDPKRFAKIVAYERKFGRNLKSATKTLPMFIEKGTPYEAITAHWTEQAMAEHLTVPITVAPQDWTLPAGAFGEDAGPT